MAHRMNLHSRPNEALLLFTPARGKCNRTLTSVISLAAILPRNMIPLRKSLAASRPLLPPPKNLGSKSSSMKARSSFKGGPGVGNASAKSPSSQWQSTAQTEILSEKTIDTSILTKGGWVQEMRIRTRCFSYQRRWTFKQPIHSRLTNNWWTHWSIVCEKHIEASFERNRVIDAPGVHISVSISLELINWTCFMKG